MPDREPQTLTEALAVIAMLRKALAAKTAQVRELQGDLNRVRRVLYLVRKAFTTVETETYNERDEQ